MKKTELARKGSIALFKLKADSWRSSHNGFEVSGANQQWHYSSDELFWAWQGFQTLVDAQNRGVLEKRSSWKPYNARGYVSLPSGMPQKAAGKVDTAGYQPCGEA